MAHGVSFNSPWFEIDGDDYFEEALEDGSLLDGIAAVQDTVSGKIEYWGYPADSVVRERAYDDEELEEVLETDE